VGELCWAAPIEISVFVVMLDDKILSRRKAMERRVFAASYEGMQFLRRYAAAALRPPAASVTRNSATKLALLKR